jgi:hypothetical protein
MSLLPHRNRHDSTISSAPCSVYHRCPHFWHLRLRTRLPHSSKRVLVTLVSVFWHSGHWLRGLASGIASFAKAHHSGLPAEERGGTIRPWNALPSTRLLSATAFLDTGCHTATSCCRQAVASSSSIRRGSRNSCPVNLLQSTDHARSRLSTPRPRHYR